MNDYECKRCIHHTCDDCQESERIPVCYQLVSCDCICEKCIDGSEYKFLLHKNYKTFWFGVLGFVLLVILLTMIKG